MEVLTLLIFLFFVFGVITLIGHGIWVSLRWFIRQLTGRTAGTEVQTLGISKCPNCNYSLSPGAEFCGHCGFHKPSGMVAELLKDLAATTRQIGRFHRSGAIDDETFHSLKAKLETEKARLTSREQAVPVGATGPVAVRSSQRLAPASVVDLGNVDITPPAPAPSVVEPLAPEVSLAEPEWPQRPDVYLSPPLIRQDTNEQTVDLAGELPRPRPGRRQEPRSVPPRPARRPFSEVLAAFMEQSNIRWGEIIGGLLIIGCSTALVVSLWAQISRIPVLKFLIFTTVTAALFGVGLYTEHRWKLPTTSRGVLTIATLLVPLNFLAIAAVSGSTDALIIGSEFIAPAVFLCLVYFAGRVLTPKWPHLLAVGVLGSSIGQLLIRHFGTPDYGPGALLALGAFPIICYVGAAAWKLHIAMADSVIDETETNAIFITLGALTFAALLPFGLLLYRSGPVSMSMMFLAPLVSLGGLPMLASGTLLWKRVSAKELRAARTAGTSIAILGTAVVLAGMILAWPNPASIVPAALLNFAVFAALAVLLDISFGHLLAALCFSLAYLVSFHVLAGHISWQNLRIVSLLDVTTTASSGQALAGLFLLFTAAFEWLSRRPRANARLAYVISACMVAIISLIFLTQYGFNVPGDPHRVCFFYLLYAAGALWLGRRTQVVWFGWVGSALLLVSLFQSLGPWLAAPFPWQTALLLQASFCALAAIVAERYREVGTRVLVDPLNKSALIVSVVAVVCLLQANPWETTVMQAERVFWLAGIWLALLWLNRRRSIFSVFQIALTIALVLSIKAALQQYDWYAYLPHAFLHPTALQIQGTVLVLLSLAWVAVRFGLKQLQLRSASGSDRVSSGGFTTVNEHPAVSGFHPPPSLGTSWVAAASKLLDSDFAVDRLVSWAVLTGFVLLSIYGVLSGVTQELTVRSGETAVWNIAGFPHQYALGLGSWILLGLLVILKLAGFCERRKERYLLGAVGTLAVICPLLAGQWEDQFATASAWRWLAALFLLAASLPLWFRDRLSQIGFSLSWPSNPGLSGEQRQTEVYRTIVPRIRVLLLATTLTPLLLLTTYPALRAIFYLPVHGPSGGVFDWLGDTLSYSVPLVIVALVLIGYALRERLLAYALVSGFLFNATVTMVYLLSVVAVQGSMDRVVSVQVLQLNAIASALFGLIWLRAHGRWSTGLTEANARQAERLLTLQAAIAIASNAAVIVPVALRLAERSSWPGSGTFAAGSSLAWLALVLTAGLVAGLNAVYQRSVRPLGLCAFLLGLGCLFAFTAARFAPAKWTGFHALMIATAVTAWLICLARSLPSLIERQSLGFFSDLFERIGKPRFAESWQRETSLIATVVGLLTVVLAVRASAWDPAGSWWAIGVLLALSALGAVLNWQTLQRVYLYAAGILISLGATIWWTTRWSEQFPGAARLLDVNVIALCLSSVVWLALELRARRKSGSDTTVILSFHHVAVLWSFAMAGSQLLLRLLFHLLSDSVLPVGRLDWLALASLVMLMAACLWDRHAKYAVAGLYLTGLLVAGMSLDAIRLWPRHLAWALLTVLAIYAIATSLLWRWRRALVGWAAQLKIPVRIDSETSELKWLALCNCLLVTGVSCLAFWIDLSFAEFMLRLTAALAVGVQALSFGLMAEGQARSHWQRAAAFMFALGAVLFGWSWLVPGLTGTWLNRAIILMVEMFAVVALFGLELDKAIEREPEWTKAIRDCVPYLTAAGIVALIFVLCTEVFYQIEFGAVRVKPLALLTVGITLAAATITCTLFALSPKHDPLNLPESQRSYYVYVAEAMLALLFMHIRLTMPWLFTGLFERYWPLVVVAIAYLGIGTSELLRRRDVLVIAHPLERTGVFLPLLPVLGFWVTGSQVDYSLLLFIVGALYGLVSILRRSFVFGILAALAGNGGLWYMLHRTDDYGFLQHPQLWLIPAAGSVLIAAYLNRKDFSEDQMIGIRYLALVTIYASSTADIFLNGVAHSPWLPMILAALSLVGIFSGIMFRIRAFLMLGSVFLLLAITTMIYYASENLGWTWLWWVAGIVTGAMILFTFALFEKKREEMLRAVEGLKEWQA